jgi:hypothetical protein
LVQFHWVLLLISITGSDGAKALKENVGKSLKQLPFEGNALVEVTDLCSVNASELEAFQEQKKEHMEKGKSEQRIRKTISMHSLLTPSTNVK